MRFNQQSFNRHLLNIGQSISWRRSYACACVNPASGAPDPKHTVCNGKGRIWDKPLTSIIGISAMKASPQLATIGLWESGDVIGTIPENSTMWDNCGRFDRVVLNNSVHAFSQPFIRGAPNEKVMFTVKSIDRCFWLDPETRAVVDGGIPLVGTGGTLDWPDGGEPANGVSYSLSGLKFDEYFIFDQLAQTRNEHSGMRLPKKVQLRKWDLFGR